MDEAAKKFKTWLDEKLLELQTDPEIFGSYIIGILEGDETNEEKFEAIEGILSEIKNENLEKLIHQILDKWRERNPQQDDEANKKFDIDIDDKLVKLLEAQKLQGIVKERQLTDEEKRIKEQILAQYSQTEVSEEDYEDSGDEATGDKQASSSGLSGIERNTNFHDVMQLQKEKREQARINSAAKKQKDKEDREKQKQLREEKKEKRKTVKGERKR